MALPNTTPNSERKANILKTAWHGWLKFAQILGTVQMVIILTVVSWVVPAIMALPFKLFSDPLAIKGPDRVRWIKREPAREMWAEMQKQG